MRSFILLTALIISNLANAEDGFHLPTFLKDVQGKYAGTYGVIKKKACTVEIKVEGEFPNTIVPVTIDRADGKTRTAYLEPGYFLDLAEGNDVTYPEYFQLHFNENKKLISANILKERAFFNFQRIRCKNLTKLQE